MYRQRNYLCRTESLVLAPNIFYFYWLAGDFKRRQFWWRDQVPNVLKKDFIEWLPFYGHARSGCSRNPAGSRFKPFFEIFCDTATEAFGTKHGALPVLGNLDGALGEKVSKVREKTAGKRLLGFS